MEEVIQQHAPLQAEDQKAVFDRVWRRVMGENADQSPVAWEPPQSPEAQEPQPQDRPPRQETALPAPQPSAPRHGSGSHPHSDFPRPEGLGVLGENCLDCVPALQELIRRELIDCKEYQTLSRRVGGSPGRSLAALAGEKKRRAKKLSAACFLISGARYFPEGETVCPPIPSYLGALRRRFAQEQATMAAYLMGAESTADPCLQQLFSDHAKECWDQACKIRALVEQV